VTATGSAEEVLDHGPVPKHAQLSAILRDLVADELAPDSPLPSERQLMARYGVSRATVRMAVGRLVTEGRLYRVPARGTFVAPPRVESQLHLASFTQDMRRRGLEPSTVVLAAELVAAPPAPVVAALRLGDGAAYRVERLRGAGGAPMAHELGWYAAAPLAGLLEADLTGSLYALLASAYGVVISTGRQTVRAEGAEPDRARLLGTHPGAALLVFERTSYAGELAVEHVTSWYRGDRYQVHMALDRHAAGGGTREGATR
jgi:GntR family transcriptional regulator, N-acetylglucosamine utilization regulator